MKSPLAVIFLTVALDLVGFGAVVPLLPLYAQELGASGTMVAFLFASYSLMQFIFAPLWGRMSDRVGRRPILLVSIAGNTFALLVYGCATTYAWLLAARLLAGICTANISVANAYVADVTTDANRAKGMGLVGAAFGIGFVIGPFLGGEMSAYGSAAPAFTAAALSAINFASAFVWLPESLPVAQRQSGPTHHVWRERWQALRGGRFPKVLLALVFIQVLGFSMMEVALVMFAKLRLGYAAQACGRIFAYVGVIMVIVQGGLIHFLVRRFGEATLVTAGLGLIAMALGLIPMTPPGGLVFLLGTLAGLGLGQGLVTPCLSSLLSRRVPATMQGAASGINQSLSSLARVVGPQLAGLVFDWGSENWPFWVGSITVSVAFGLAVLRLR